MEKYSQILFVTSSENLFENRFENGLKELSLIKDKCVYDKDDKSFFISNKYFSVKIKLVILDLNNSLLEYIKDNYEYEGMIFLCDCITANNIIVSNF